MVLIGLILVVVIFFLAISVFSKELRDKIIEKIRDLVNKVFDVAPIEIDKIVTDPLKEQLSKLKAGKTIGGIELGI